MRAFHWLLCSATRPALLPGHEILPEDPLLAAAAVDEGAVHVLEEADFDFESQPVPPGVPSQFLGLRDLTGTGGLWKKEIFVPMMGLISPNTRLASLSLFLSLSLSSSLTLSFLSVFLSPSLFLLLLSAIPQPSKTRKWLAGT